MMLVTFSFYLTEKILIFEWLYLFLQLSVFNISSCVRIRLIRSLKTTSQTYSNSDYCGRYTYASACTNIQIPVYRMWMSFYVNKSRTYYSYVQLVIHSVYSIARALLLLVRNYGDPTHFMTNLLIMTNIWQKNI